MVSSLMGANMSGAPTRGGTAQSQSRGGKQVAPVPFVRASVEHRESCGYDVTTVQSAAVQTLPDVVIPAYGFLRAIILVVTTTAGTGTTVVATEDSPFNALANIILQEPNGAQICNFPSGYDAFMANKYGGYWFHNDPRQDGNFSEALGTNANFSFCIRIPVETNLRDAVGALPNQNSGAQFRLKLNLSPFATVFGGTPGVFPSVRVRAFAEEWDQPEDMTDGQPNQTTPPALNTTQYWSRQDFAINAGNFNVRLTRVGNLIRNLIFIYRNATPARGANDANMPDPTTLYYDTRPLDSISRPQWISQQRDRYGIIASLGNTNSAAGTAVALDSGSGREASVWPYDFCHEFGGFVGRELRDLWLPTLSSTRLEIGGTWGASGTLTVLTNDVTIADNVWL
jgi:hypothetical protein